VLSTPPRGFSFSEKKNIAVARTTGASAPSSSRPLQGQYTFWVLYFLGHQSLEIGHHCKVDLFAELQICLTVATPPLLCPTFISFKFGPQSKGSIPTGRQNATKPKLTLWFWHFSAPSRDRTYDLLLKRELLYRLSYRRIFFTFYRRKMCVHYTILNRQIKREDTSSGNEEGDADGEEEDGCNSVREALVREGVSKYQ
jgi:hypothetical protein